MLHKRIISFLAFAFILHLFSSPALSQLSSPSLLHPSWNFKETEGWTAGEGVTDFNAQDGKLKISSRSFSYIMGPTLNFDADINGLIKIGMKSDAPYSEASIFWVTSSDKMFDIRKNIPFVTRGDNKFHIYYISMKKNPLWKGKVIQLIFSPSVGAGNFEVDFIKTERLSLLGRFICGWQEFFSFEPVKPRTINIIMGQTIGGKHINFWIYLLCFLSFIFFTARSFLQNLKNKNETIVGVLKSSLYTTIILALFFWVMLEGRMAIDYLRIFRQDINEYGGKTVEEKIKRSIPGDFYEFTKFCKDKIPGKSLVTVMFPSDYHICLWRYHNYPLRYTKNEGAPYIAVYYPSQSQVEKINKLKGYVLFEKFEDNELILKKIKENK